MKIALIVWNAVLTVLVCILWFNKPVNDAPIDAAEIADIEYAENDTSNVGSQKENKIVFINTDSLFNKYDMYKDLQEELLAEKIKLEAKYKKELEKLEKEYYELREKAPFMTQSQGEAAQADLMKKQQDLVEMEQDLSSKFVKKETELVERIRKSLETYITELNKEKKYNFVLGKSNLSGILYADKGLDITDELILGLNKSYQASKSKK
ncbi:MAG: OmpH family outer membrane protein [Flavobacteriales bacterium]|nr:OmpH family outer membrane protein [Flavobacteriales bacterium]